MLKQLTVFNPQVEKSFLAAAEKFLADVPEGYRPRIGVVGIAGAVTKNTVQTVNISHWGITDGNAIATALGFDAFTFINDFTAAGYGVTTLQDEDIESIDGSSAERREGPNSVKVVIGPGTGLGQGLLVKGADPDGWYEPYPSEGGHSDFSVRN